MIPGLDRDDLSVGDLEGIHLSQGNSLNFAARCIAELDRLDEDRVWRAIWLLNRRARTRGLSPETVRQLAERADGLRHWLARLHLCQLFATTGCPPESRESVFPFFLECFADPRVIIRAWALTAVERFSEDLAYRKPYIAMLRRARKDPAKSMQARLRHLANDSSPPPSSEP